MPNIDQLGVDGSSLNALLSYINIAHQCNRTYTLSLDAQVATKVEHEFWMAKTQEAYYSDFTLR
jgi:hypothetical protein